MQMFIKNGKERGSFNSLILSCLAATTLVLSGCGSDESGGGSSAISTTINGTAIDGYISGATVCLDTNENELCDSTEPTTTTDSDGKFTLTVTNNGTYLLLVTGGIDTATNESFKGTLKQIVTLDGTTTLNSNITPLTTLSANLYLEQKKIDPNYTLAMAKQTIATNLGLDISKIDTDPMKDAQAFIKNQQLVQITEVLAQSIIEQNTESNTTKVFSLIMKNIAQSIKDDNTTSNVNIVNIVDEIEKSPDISIDSRISSFLQTFLEKIKEEVENKDANTTFEELQKTFQEKTIDAIQKIEENNLAELEYIWNPKEIEPIPTYSWSTGSWGACSGDCGIDNATQSRTVTCTASTGEDVADGMCSTAKPATTQACTASICPPPITYSWSLGDWGTCSGECGTNNATQSRTVTCTASTGGDVDDGMCSTAKPAISQACTASVCDTPDETEPVIAQEDIDAVEAEIQGLNILYAAGDSNDSVTQDITLPTPQNSSITMTWITSQSTLISLAGHVVRPIVGTGDQLVELTARASLNGAIRSRTFSLLVKEAPLEDSDAVSMDKEALAISYNSSDSADSVTLNVTLPTSGTNGSIISWSSNNSAIRTTGQVVRPPYGTGDTPVTLTATIKKGLEEQTKTFDLIVKQAEQDPLDAIANDMAYAVPQFAEGDSAESITEDIILPTSGPSGTTFTWEFFDFNDGPLDGQKVDDVILQDGTVNRPALGITEDYKMLAQVTVSKSGEKKTNLYLLVIKPVTMEGVLGKLGVNTELPARKDVEGNEVSSDFHPLRDTDIVLGDANELAAYLSGGSIHGIYDNFLDVQSGEVQALSNLYNDTQFSALEGRVKAIASANMDNDSFEEMIVAHENDQGYIDIKIINDSEQSYGVLRERLNVAETINRERIANPPLDIVGSCQMFNNCDTLPPILEETDMDIATGDLNGDGVDEIIVTVGRRNYESERVFDSISSAYETVYTDASSKAFMLILDHNLNVLHTTNYSNATQLRVATGDLDDDGKDEIALAVSGVYSDNTVRQYIYSFNGNSLNTDYYNSRMSSYQNPSFADVTVGDLDRNGVPEAIFAGSHQNVEYGEQAQNLSFTGPHFWHIIESIGFDRVNYNAIVKGFIADETSTNWSSASVGCQNFNAEQADEYKDEVSYIRNGCNIIEAMDVFAETLDIDGDGYAELLVNNTVYNSDLTIKLDAKGDAMYFGELMNEGNQGLDAVPSPFFSRSNYSVVVGDFTGDNKDNILFTSRNRSSVPIVGVKNDGSFANLKNGYISEFKFNNTYADNTYPLLAAANTANDGLHLQYKESYSTFTEPLTLAVVAAAPCWDAEWQNLQECSSFYGTISGQSTSEENGYELSASVKIGGKFEKPAVEVEVVGTVSAYYEWQFGTEYSVTKEISYNSGGNEDIVIFTSIPYDVYVYTIMKSANEDEVGEEMRIYTPRKPVTRQATVDYYNNVVKHYAPNKVIGLETITHTAGDPYSYATPSEKDALLSKYSGLENGDIGVGMGTGSTEISIEETSTETFEETFGGSVEVDVQVTAGPVILGASVGVGFSNDIGWANTSGTAVGGTVGAIEDEEYAGRNYSFGIFTYTKDDHPGSTPFKVVDFWTEQ